MNNDEALNTLGQKIHDAKFAMLTTVEPDGTLRSRPMATLESTFDGTIWFFTRHSSAKVSEIEREQHVNLSYAKPDGQLYVSISGKAETVQDKEKEKELWNPVFRTWFPDGIDDPELVLLKVTVEKAEYWDSPSSSAVHLFGLAKAMVTRKPPHPGENVKVDLQ